MIEGSIEVLFNEGAISEGIVVETPDPDRLPEALAILRGFEGFAPVDPPREGADREWTARTHEGFAVAVLFRETRIAGPRIET